MDGKTDKGVEGRRRESGKKGKEKDGGRLILDLLGLPCLYLFPFYFQNLSGTLWHRAGPSGAPGHKSLSVSTDKWNIYKCTGIFINGIFPAILVNKGWCHRHRWLQPSNVSQWALREPRAEKNTSHLAAKRQQPLPTVSPEETQDVKTQDTGPRWLRCISKEWFQWAQTLPSSHT